jgi:hypothetical protein
MEQPLPLLSNRGFIHGVVTVSKNDSGRITVSFPYNSILVAKVKTIEGRKWHKDKKYRSFPDTDGKLEEILKSFEGEEVRIDPILQAKLPTHVIASPDKIGTKQSLHNFEDLRRELVSRKYSYKTIKGYVYYNKDFLNFTGKSPYAITDNYIKDYLAYLAEEKQSATSTLNQAINALKFYYGAMLKKKFVYEVKRPRKDKKLPVVLSKEEVAKILSSVDNIKHKAILMLVYSAGLRVGIDEYYKNLRDNIDWSDMPLQTMGRQFTRIHKLQRERVLGRDTDKYIEFANKAMHPCVAASWAYTAGFLQRATEALNNHYALADLDPPGDPLNAKALLNARLKGVDPDTYRGLGARINNVELGRMLEVFLLQATKATQRGITQKLANAAIKSYEAKRAKSEADRALKGI